MGYALRSVLMALVVSFVIAYLLNPPVYYLHALRVPRRAGAFMVLGGFIGIIVTLVFAVLPGVTRELFEASSRVPEQFDAFRKNSGQWLQDHFHVQLPGNVDELMAKFGNEIRNLAPNSSDIAGAFNRAMDSLWAALSSLIVLIFAFYLLADFDGIVKYSRKLIPRRMASGVEGLIIEIDNVISRYIRGQAIRSLILAILYAIGLRIVGTKHALPLGVMIGILTFIPYVGVLFGSLLVLFTTLLDWQSLSHVGAVVAIMTVIIVADSQLITPGIIGTSAPLKSLEVLLAMIGSVSLLGPVGVVIAVPLGAVIKILLRRIVDAYRNSAFYLGIVEPAIQPAGDVRSSRESIPPVPRTGRDSIPPVARTGFESISPPARPERESRTSIVPPPLLNLAARVRTAFRSDPGKDPSDDSGQT
jgi:predicted PurR-regulated permease PerM